MVFWDESSPGPMFSYYSNTLGKPTPPRPVSGALRWTAPPAGQPAKKTMKQLWDMVQEFADRLENADDGDDETTSGRPPDSRPAVPPGTSRTIARPPASRRAQ